MTALHIGQFVGAPPVGGKRAQPSTQVEHRSWSEELARARIDANQLKAASPTAEKRPTPPSSAPRALQTRGAPVARSASLAVEAARGISSAPDSAAAGIGSSHEPADAPPSRKRVDDEHRLHAIASGITALFHSPISPQFGLAESEPDVAGGHRDASPSFNDLQSAQEPIRLHVDWSGEGVRLWLGMDSGAQGALQPLAARLQRWLNNEGHKLISLSCNGQTVLGGAAGHAASIQPGATAPTSHFTPKEAT